MRLRVLALGLVLFLGACGSDASQSDEVSASPSATTSPTSTASPTAASSASTASPASTPTPPATEGLASIPLREGERDIDLRLPDGPYTPKAEAGGTDDYRCFLLDPGVTSDSWITGVGVMPDNAAITHHAIVYRVDPASIPDAKRLDAATPETGWSCFGGSGVTDQGGFRGALDSAPWLAAWAPGGKPEVFSPGFGVRIPKGSMVILQMHYNLLGGTGQDNSHVEMRLQSGTRQMRALETMLLPAPVELPCAPGESGRLCSRGEALTDLATRFGPASMGMVGGLQLLCGGDPFKPKAGPTQSCERSIAEPTTLVSVAGHMHLLGKSISIDVIRQSGRSVPVLRIPVWDFDDQRARRLPAPVALRPGDRLRVTCTHDASLRSKLPELKGRPARYVMWGEGTSDEMCLGIAIVTRP